MPFTELEQVYTAFYGSAVDILWSEVQHGLEIEETVKWLAQHYDTFHEEYSAFQLEYIGSVTPILTKFQSEKQKIEGKIEKNLDELSVIDVSSSVRYRLEIIKQYKKNLSDLISTTKKKIREEVLQPKLPGFNKAVGHVSASISDPYEMTSERFIKIFAQKYVSDNMLSMSDTRNHEKTDECMDSFVNYLLTMATVSGKSDFATDAVEHLLLEEKTRYSKERPFLSRFSMGSHLRKYCMSLNDVVTKDFAELMPRTTTFLIAESSKESEQLSALLKSTRTRLNDILGVQN